MDDTKYFERFVDLGDSGPAEDDTPGMYRLRAFAERLERLVLYDATMTADDAREMRALGIGEIDVKRQRLRLSPQFAAAIRRKAAN